MEVKVSEERGTVKVEGVLRAQDSEIEYDTSRIINLLNDILGRPTGFSPRTFTEWLSDRQLYRAGAVTWFSSRMLGCNVGGLISWDEKVRHLYEDKVVVLPGGSLTMSIYVWLADPEETPDERERVMAIAEQFRVILVTVEGTPR